MRIVAVSDTHTFHQDIELPPGDLLVHAGDFSFNGQPKEVTAFFEWFSKQPHRLKIVVAGNHDRLFESAPVQARSLVPGNVIYLEDSGCELEGVHFWGSPWQPWFMDWAFNLETETERQQKWSLIPRQTDVLVTHGPPFGILDRCFDGRRVGCAALARTVKKIMPRLHIFGHIHEGYGLIAAASGTTFLNASICDEAYRPVNPPMVVEID